jgi:hypothetical protein
MMLHPDEATAIDRGIDGAHFFGYSLGHFYGGGTHRVGDSNLWQSFGTDRTEHGFAREIISASAQPLAVRLLQAGMGSLRGAIGTPAQVAELIARYEAAGVDQLMFAIQAGNNRHEHICESIELFAREVLPRFADGREQKELAKADRLAAAVDKALARRVGPRSMPVPYQVDEDAEIAAPGRPARAPLRDLAGQARHAARESLRGRGQAGLRRVLDRMPDTRLEQVFGSSRAQRAVFGMMTRQFDPARTANFDGAIVYDLGLADGTRQPWSIEVHGGQARIHRGGSADAALTIKVPLTDFIRVLTTSGSFYPLILDGRMTMEGDLALANRMPEMFGARSAY